MRSGDVVLHRPSGENWLLAYGNDDSGRDEVAPCGWPLGIVRPSDCELLDAASDEKHVETLLLCARMRPNERGWTDLRTSMARDILTRRGIQWETTEARE